LNDGIYGSFEDGSDMKQIHDKEFAAILGLPAPDRYELFVKRVVDWGAAWSLRTDGGWSLFEDSAGVEMTPVWPHQRFAETCAETQKNERAAMITLDDWLDKWLPGLKADGRHVAVFPVPGGNGILVSPDRLLADLKAECERYESLREP
jgi:Protein of unknown function (DUF2750)